MKGFLTFFGILLITSSIFADDAIPVPKVSGNFVFDGIVSDEEWSHITPLELTVQIPVYHGVPSEHTIIKMGYDENYIYLSGELFLKDMSKLNNNTKMRDGGDESSEWFGLVIDSYNDKQNALSFFTTPSGSRFDAAISNDAVSGNPMNISWNNFWDVKTTLTEEGWFAEMRIPFTSLQYQVVDGKVTMGITVWRYIGGANEMQISPDISPDMGDMASFRPSLAKEYVFENVRQKKPFYITPYVLGGYGTSNELNEASTAYVKENSVKRNLGLDVKYGITNNFTLDLSVNTDFAQVEADDQQVNLSRFSLFFPEKRLFFQERSGIFDFSLGSRSNLFYSRRIGIDDGNTIPILGGARLTGRTGNLDIGLISMQTQGTDEFLSTNYSVFRVKKQVFNENSQIGFLLTNNIDTDGEHNTVYGFDSSIRFYKQNFFSFKFAQSISSDYETQLASSDPSVIWFSIANRAQRGFTYAASLSRLGEKFESGLAFLDRTNYTRLGSRLAYNWFSGENSVLFRHGPTIRGVSYWDNATNLYNTAFYGVGYNLTFKNGMSIYVGNRIQYDDITSNFELSDDAYVPVGSYFFQGLNMELSSPTGRRIVAKGEISSGQFYDGRRNSIQIAPVFNISSSLNLTGTYEYNDVSFNSRDQNLIVHIARLKANIMFTTKFSISSFIQYNSIGNLFLGNIRLRYNPKEGNDLFVVFNSDLNSQRSLGDPRLPSSNQSTVLLKYSYTFRI